MKLTFLGTSAANAYPEAFCNCENCQRARLLGGKSLRKRSAALINDDLLIVVLDHTYGPDQTGSDHLSARQVSQHTKRLQSEGFLKKGGRVFATHIAHEGNPVHPELEEFASRQGYEVAYDGLSLNIRHNPLK
jgi:phosphoribosyl 1,2-cyclic phosphodiesterase